jgi:hypothetical protein
MGVPVKVDARRAMRKTEIAQQPAETLIAAIGAPSGSNGLKPMTGMGWRE